MNKITKFLAILATLALFSNCANAQKIVEPCTQTSGSPCVAVSTTNPLPVTITGPISTVVNLGTSTSNTSPRIAGDATSGFYTAGAGKVDISISGSQVGEFTSAGFALNQPLGVTSGGTGANTANGALTNLWGTITGYVSGYINYFLQDGPNWIAMPYFEAGGSYSFSAYVVGTTGSLPSGNIGTVLQAALLDAQLQQVTISHFDFRNDLLEAEKMDFVIESIPNAQIGQTITIPNLLRVKNHAVFQGLHSGTATSPCNNTAGYFDGSACANLSATTVGPFIPMFIVAQGAETENLSLDAADPSSVAGDGVEYSGAWEAASVTVQATGSSYPNSFNASTVLVDKWGLPVNMACTASGGVVTGCSLTSGVRFNRNNGIFNLPPALQKTQWCNSAFISAVGLSAFDAGCNYYATTTGGAGTGLTVSITWFPPYCTGSSGTGYASCTASTLQEFLYSSIGVQTAEVQKYTHVTNAGSTVANASYGDMYAVGVAAQNNDFLDMFTQGGGRSLYLTANATDNHIIAAYAYAGAINFTLAGTNNVWIGPTSDSPTQTAFDFQKGTGVVHGLKLYANSASSTTSSNTVIFGDGNVTWGPLHFDVTSENSGAGASAAFASIDYMGDGNELDFNVNNSGTFTSSNLITFGTHNTVNSSSKIRGVVDGISAANMCLNQSNAINAVIGMDVWDAYDAMRIVDGCVPESADGAIVQMLSGVYYPPPIGSYSGATQGTGGTAAWMTCTPRYLPAGAHVTSANVLVNTNSVGATTTWHDCWYPDLGIGYPYTQPLWLDIKGTISSNATGAQSASTFATGSATTPMPWRLWWDCLEFSPVASGTFNLEATNGGSGSDIILTSQVGVSSVTTTIPGGAGYNGSGFTYSATACPATPSTGGSFSAVTNSTNLPINYIKR